MKRVLAIVGAVVVAAIFVALIAPMWVMTAGIELSGFALAMIAAMIVGCFAVGGGLMFLVFYSARQGYDDAVHHGIRRRDPGDP